MSSIKQLQEDVAILKIQNNKLQEELSYEKDERMKMSIILCDIVEKLKQNGITICEEKKEEVDEDVTLPPTVEADEESEYIPDEKTPKSEEYKSLTSSPYNEEQEKTMNTMEKVLMIDEFRNSSKTTQELIEQTEKFMKMTTMVDSFDELSDGEDFEEESVDLQLTMEEEPVKAMTPSLQFTISEEKPKTYSELPETIVSEQPELPPTVVDEPTPVPVVEETLEDTMAILEQNSPKVNTDEPPLPSNLCMSPMTPVNEIKAEDLIDYKAEEEFLRQNMKKNEEIKYEENGKPYIAKKPKKAKKTKKVKKIEEEKVEEQKVEEETVEENINYSKMKVGDLKKLCKERGIKGFSKMKKKELVELLQQ